MNMKFKDFSFPQNPALIRVEEARTIKEKCIPLSVTSLWDLGKKRRRVFGKGTFEGEDCVKVWQELQRIYTEGGNGFLSVPGFPSFVAILDSLQLIGPATDGCVQYSFSFTEVLSSSEWTGARDCKAEEGESLWDYADRYHRSIESLIAANPDIRDIEALTAGEKVVVP